MDLNEIKDDKKSSKELTKRLEESENTYKLYGFSHIIIIRSVVDIMDTSFRKIIDGMYRRTKSHCKTDEEVELYRQRLCKLYLTFVKRGLANVERLEPKLSTILTVEVENSTVNLNDRLIELKNKIAERTKRVQSLLALQHRLKTNTILAEWVISKVEPIVYKAETDFTNLENVSPNSVQSILNSLNRINRCLQCLEFNQY